MPRHRRSLNQAFNRFVGIWTLALAFNLSGCGFGPGSGPGRGNTTSSRAVELIVVPDDSTANILTAIRSARRRVLVEMYMLTSVDAVDALLMARAAGCEVRVLLEPTPYGDAMANQAAFMALTAAGVDVRWIGRPKGLVHTKLVVVDDAVAYVMSLNLTMSGLATNREYVIVDSDPADRTRLLAIWNADAQGADPGATLARTRIVASPIDSRPRLGAAIDGAVGSIAIEIEEFSDGDFTTRLIGAHDRGVVVTIVVPATNRSASTTATLNQLSASGVVVRTSATPTVHAKAMVVDGRQVYVGSVNFTRASLDDNREIGFLTNDSPALATRVGTTIATDAATGAPL
jgi:cardiolipin synthase